MIKAQNPLAVLEGAIRHLKGPRGDPSLDLSGGPRDILQRAAVLEEGKRPTYGTLAKLGFSPDDVKDIHKFNRFTVADALAERLPERQPNGMGSTLHPPGEGSTIRISHSRPPGVPGGPGVRDWEVSPPPVGSPPPAKKGFFEDLFGTNESIIFNQGGMGSGGNMEKPAGVTIKTTPDAHAAVTDAHAAVKSAGADPWASLFLRGG